MGNNGWRDVTVEELKAPTENALATGPFGSSISSRYFQDNGVPVIRGSNLSEDIGTRINDYGLVFISEEKAAEFKRSIVRKGDLVFTCWGTINQVGLIDKRAKYSEYVISNKQMKFTPDPKKADSLFLYYLFSGPQMQNLIKNCGIGSSVPGFNLGQLRTIRLTLPEPDEQRAIAHILGTLDDKIELNRRMNETLEAMARTIFKSWFVDFDPVRAKVEGHDPGLPKHIADLFPNRFEDSELGEIPAGWKVKTISDVAERVGMGPFGSSIKVETFIPEGVPIISGQHLNGFMLEDNKFNFISVEHAERLSNSNVQRGDVVFTHAGNIGQAAYIPECSRYERYVISQRQFFMRCDRSQVTPSFIAIYFNSPEGQHQLLANTSSSGVPSIARPVTYLRTIKLVIPPKSILNAFEKLTAPILLRFRRNFDESDTLSALRDKLLPKLISGELRVKDAERFIGKAV